MYQTLSKETRNESLLLDEEEIKNYALADIEKLLNNIGKSLKDFPPMPFLESEYMNNFGNQLILEETSYDVHQMSIEHSRFVCNLNNEQRKIYDTILHAIYAKEGGIFFVHGSGGCGKTFLWKTIIYRLRSERKIVLPVASSGIAAVLLPGGRTAHSRFHIPLILDSTSTAGIKHGTKIAELIQNTSLIIWDEAPMQHRHAFEAVDRSLRDIMSEVDEKNSRKPFGGITVLLGGDFRQNLPVINKGSRADIVNSLLNRSGLWEYCHIFSLHKNMRLHSGNSVAENKVIDEFSKWVLRVGDGKEAHECEDNGEHCNAIHIPDEYVLHTAGDKIEAIINATYPDLMINFSNPQYLKDRAILSPTNAAVDDINKRVLQRIPGKLYTYLSIDSIDDGPADENDLESSFPVEYLNSINISGLPKHELALKEGIVVMLIRNLNQIVGLCNGTRMIIRKCMKNTLLCEIISGGHVGSMHLIPRIEMAPTDTKFPFNFTRRQFPVQICYAMTINKSQGQSLENVGLYLPNSVFSHGQLYVAISRVTSPQGLRILIEKDSGETSSTTHNIVYEEVFYNLQE